MSRADPAECCPPFDPQPWQEREMSWENRLFVKDRVRSFLRIPWNFAAVMTRNVAAIEAAEAMDDPFFMMVDENSLWGADILIAVRQPVPGKTLVRISGTFVTQVHEGPFRDIPKWIAAQKDLVRSRGQEMSKLYFYYTTCPKCAKKYGKNYVVLLAQVAGEGVATPA